MKANKIGVKERSFYSLSEFEQWKSATSNHKTYNIKRYNGLASLTSAEAKVCFSNIDRYRIPFKYNNDDDKDDNANIVMAFGKRQKDVDQRKEFLTTHMNNCSEQCLYTEETKFISYTEFIELELLPSLNADKIHSIPSMVDGLTSDKEKFCTFASNVTTKVK